MSAQPETIVCRLTPNLPAAIATIAIQGSQAKTVVEQLLKSRPLVLNRIRFGAWPINDSVNPSDSQHQSKCEQIVACLTRVDRVELHCHGGNAICRHIISQLVAAGCREVSADQWPSNFSNEIQQAAEEDLIRTTSTRTAAILLDQLNGALSQAMSQIVQQLDAGDKTTAQDCVRELLNWSDLGLHLVNPWQVVLAGPPNCGKSSLINAIAGGRRAIVHHEAGTTRDWIEVLTAVDGWPIALTDTAGVRDSSDAIESEGIRRSLMRAAVADALVIVVDATVGWTNTHQELLNVAATDRILVAWNKSDLQPQVPDTLRKLSYPIVASHSVSEVGIVSLLAQLAHILVPAAPAPRAAIPFRREQIEWLRSLGA